MIFIRLGKTTIMKKLLLLAPMLIAFQYCTAANYKFTYNGKKYEIIKEKKTWTDAAMFANSKNGHLVEIDDQAEQVAIYDAIQKSGISPTYTQAKDAGSVAYIWIGATDRGHEGNWIWDGTNKGSGKTFWTGEGIHGKGNGEAVNNAYENWGRASSAKPNEPDNSGGKQNAAAMGLAPWPKNSGQLGKAGEWNDINEDNQLYFIIEYDK